MTDVGKINVVFNLIHLDPQSIKENIQVQHLIAYQFETPFVINLRVASILVHNVLYSQTQTEFHSGRAKLFTAFEPSAFKPLSRAELWRRK